jgi:hypothetical protein
VGLTVTEPLAAVLVMAPGAMAIEVAPLVVQLSVVLEPESMLIGCAVNALTAGAAPPPEDVVPLAAEPSDEPPQLTSARHASAAHTLRAARSAGSSR